MAKKHKHQAAPVSSAELAARVRRAESEGRTQQSLELAKQLFKQEPTAAYQEILKRVYLARARHLRQQGYTRDAGTVLEAALAVGGADLAWLEKAAEEMAAVGLVSKALALLERIPNSPARTRVLNQGVDQALRQGRAGRNLLPETLQGPFDRILQAFAQLEAGQDELARAALQEIGLQSPFLEWKVLLRGLAAYYQNDDVRAVENWQRLAPDRLPARLAAPLRFGIDPDYRTAQEPQTQAALQKQLDRLQDGGPVQNLRAIQAALVTGDESLAQPFRLAENLLPLLRRTNPELIPRLASCFYWAIVSHGAPEDKNRYRRIFGAPPDDPDFARLEALVTEHVGEMDAAHQYWQNFEQAVAGNAAAWPGGQADRVRALIWSHMGGNAALIPNAKKMAQLPPFLRDHPQRSKALRPNAEDCFRRSIKLAPDQLEPYEKLFQFYQQEEKPKKAEKAARQLLERFPNHLPTLAALADLRSQAHDYAEAVRLLQQALQANPLDRRLREKLGNAHLFNARSLAEASQFEEARTEYRTSLALNGSHEHSVLCKWAACEFKAGDTARAEELMTQALAKAGTRLATAYSMLIETIRLKLPRPLKSRFDQDFTEALAEAPTAAGSLAVADMAAVHRNADVTYVGQKTHEKKVLGYLERARKTVEFTEAQLEELLPALLGLEAIKMLRSFVVIGGRRFPRNPFFPLMEAKSYLTLKKKKFDGKFWKVKYPLEEAARLAGELPPGDKNKALLEEIHEYQQMAAAFDPFGGMFQNMFDTLSDFGEAWEGEEEDEDDDWLSDEGWGSAEEDDAPPNPSGRPGKRKRR